jgi:type IV pilus assembly protein PilM
MDNPFLSLFNFIMKAPLFGTGEKRAVGIDIGTSSLKVVELKKKGNKVTLTRYGLLSLGGYGNKESGQAVKLPPEKLAEALNFLLAEEKFTAQKAVFSIPLSSSLIFIIEVPAAARDRLDTVVPFEARKHVPVAYTDVSMVWVPLIEKEADVLGANKASANAPLRVLVIAVLKPVVELYQGLATNAGFESVLFEVETFSMIRSLTRSEHGVYALIDIGADTTKVAVIDGGVVVFSHSIDKGSQDITESLANQKSISFKEAEELKKHSQNVPGAEGIFGTIFSEATQALHGVSKRSGHVAAKTILVGGGSVLSGTAPLAAGILGHEVTLGDPFISILPPAKTVGPLLTEIGPELAVATGLALRGIEEL